MTMTKFKFSKRIRCITLSIMLIIGLSPMTVLAADGDSCEETECSGIYANGICSYASTHYESAPINVQGQYEISSTGQLMWFAAKVNAQDITSHHAILMNDIVIDDAVVDWTPIMLKDNCPSVFDGNGYTITLDVDLTNLGNSAIGLFAKYNYSTVMNLTLKGEIVCNSTTVGAVVGSAYRTTILNVQSYVNITNAATEGGTGGLSGQFGGGEGDGQYSLIENCAVYADINGGGSAGGLVGNIWGGYQYCTIRNSSFVGNVNGAVNSGAIVGYNGNNSSTTSTIKNVSYDEKDGIHFIGNKGNGNLSTENISIKPASEDALSGRTFELKDGVILDLRDLTGNPENVTINIIGSGIVLSTDELKFRNSVVDVHGNDLSDYVLLRNVYITDASLDKLTEMGLHISGVVDVDVVGCDFVNCVDERQEVYDIELLADEYCGLYISFHDLDVKIRLVGSTGQTDWITLNVANIGDGVLDFVGSCAANCVGDIQYIDFEIYDDQCAYWLKKITVKGRNYGSEFDSYIGRKLGSTIADDVFQCFTVRQTDNVYEVRIKTGTEASSGTRDDVHIYLRDAKGKVTTTYQVAESFVAINDFLIGERSKVYVYAPDDFGECVNAVLFTEPHVYSEMLSADGWLLDALDISKVQGRSEDSGYVVYPHQWFEENDHPISFGKYSGRTGAFYLEVKTSNKSKAGTDSNIYLTIYGSRGNTGEINLGTYASTGNDFEKNDKDCFYIGYDVEAIGTIYQIKIRKDDKGIGPDWHLDYINITEVVAEGQKAQSVTFDIDQWIRNDTYTFGPSYVSSTTLKSSGSVNRELLSGLIANEDGSYTLVVDEPVNITEDSFDLLSENGFVFTAEMMDDADEMIYAITFDGSQFESAPGIQLKRGYSFTDGSAIVDFLAEAALPQGTTVRINAKFLGFDTEDTFVVLTRESDNAWSNEVLIETATETRTITLEEGITLLVNDLDDELPAVDMSDDLSEILDTENIVKVADITAENVTRTDKEDLQNAKADLEMILEDYVDDLTDEEKEIIEAEIGRIDEALAELNETVHTEHVDADGDDKCDICGEDYNNSTEVPGTVVPSDSPQTGDNNNLWLWFALLLVSAMSVFGFTVYDRKRKMGRTYE